MRVAAQNTILDASATNMLLKRQGGSETENLLFIPTSSVYLSETHSLLCEVGSPLCDYPEVILGGK